LTGRTESKFATIKEFAGVPATAAYGEKLPFPTNAMNGKNALESGHCSLAQWLGSEARWPSHGQEPVRGFILSGPPDSTGYRQDRT
jgi:hypothetical protein